VAGILGSFSDISDTERVCLTGTINAPEARISLKGQHFNVQGVLTSYWHLTLSP